MRNAAAHASRPKDTTAVTFVLTGEIVVGSYVPRLDRGQHAVAGPCARSCVRSSLNRDHSRNSTISGSVGSSRRKQCASVRSAEASTRASRRSSFAPAGEIRSQD